MCLNDKHAPPKVVKARRRGFWDFWAKLRPGKRFTGATLVVVPSHLFQQWRVAIEQLAGDALLVHCFDKYEDVARLYDEGQSGALLRAADIYLVSSLYYQTVAQTLVTSDVTFRRLVMDEADSMGPMINFAAPATVTWFVSATLDAAVAAASVASVASVPANASSSDNGLRIGQHYVVPATVMVANSVDCDPVFVRAAFALPDVDVRPPVVFDDAAFAAVAPLLAGGGDAGDRIARALFACDAREFLVAETRGHSCERTERGVAEALLRGWRSALETVDRRLSGNDKHKPEVRAADAAMATKLRARVLALEDALPLPESDATSFAKLAALTGICKRAHETREKTLVFCEFPGLLTLLSTELMRDGVPHVDLERDGGTIAKMAAAFERYNGVTDTDTDSCVMLMHSGMFSCGVNLEATAHVVLTHRLIESLRTQVIGRAQRPGRSGSLAVTQLLYGAE
jgi:hypothetical protein